jgi:hypothetical protein
MADPFRRLSLRLHQHHRGPDPGSDAELNIYLDSFHFVQDLQLGPPAIKQLLQLGL